MHRKLITHKRNDIGKLCFFYSSKKFDHFKHLSTTLFIVIDHFREWDHFICYPFTNRFSTLSVPHSFIHIRHFAKDCMLPPWCICNADSRQHPTQFALYSLPAVIAAGAVRRTCAVLFSELFNEIILAMCSLPRSLQLDQFHSITATCFFTMILNIFDGFKNLESCEPSNQECLPAINL